MDVDRIMSPGSSDVTLTLSTSRPTTDPPRRPRQVGAHDGISSATILDHELSDQNQLTL